jgi:Type II secretion system (T2SS), protein E, N-terminal domain
VLLQALPAIGGAVGVRGGSSVSERKFGELLIEEAAITREQLEEALRVQSTLRHYLPLGQVLLNRGRLTRALLTTLLKRHRKSARLGELLVRSGQITTDQLQTALSAQGQTRRPLGHTLMALGYVSEETLRGALCAQLHINFFDLDLIKLDPALARLVNEKYANRRRGVPLFRAGAMLVVAVDDPTDTTVVEELQQLLGLRVEVVTSTTAKIQRAITRLYGEGARSSEDPCLYHNILIGIVRDQEVADVAAKALGVKILPPYWQSR